PSGFWFSTIFLVVSGVVVDLRLKSVEDTVSAVCCTVSVVYLTALPKYEPIPPNPQPFFSFFCSLFSSVDTLIVFSETVLITYFSQDSKTSFSNFSSLICSCNQARAFSF
ncbi:hypothetical protein GLOIN_2v1539732, partial [Rhizophagus irregularis DAOM 181602=DAOM 197198]